jgi:hypothetical protein
MEVNELPGGGKWTSENIANFHMFKLNFRVVFVFCSKWTSQNNVNFYIFVFEVNFSIFMFSYAAVFWTSEFGESELHQSAKVNI